ncbi:hypothetical protein OKW21_005333 [Catalinimonas alkaloidigena]|uniref:hypothetical protein n=1 Tax=Catalinimonas alkaloidigena TaxID=1075417 RepID=UPI002404C853|nr:hypothetical protein [Catalinimonas alkaloidigena]MDF9800070.1 hypothetical protein [Catalinimonas alkaloidigena]
MNNIKLIYIGLLIWMMPTLLGAQNLVPNPSFEEYKSDTNCLIVSSKKEFISIMENWTMPTDGTADILNNNYRITCRMHPTPDDRFALGTQSPRSGDLMAGIFTYNDISYREYLQVKLDQPIEQGQRYIAGMYVSLADSVQLASNNLGMFFSQTAIDLDTTRVIQAIPSINNNTVITERNGWVLVSDTFRLDYDATHLLIGNFFENENTTVQRVRDTVGTFRLTYLLNLCPTTFLFQTYSLPTMME